jgi:hypothetical protein
MFSGFRVALAIASLPGMTPKLFNELREHHTRESLTLFLASLADSESFYQPQKIFLMKTQ